MDKPVSPQDGSYRATALALMDQALALLDQDGGVPEVGAQLDLAICRLRDALGTYQPLDSAPPAQPFDPDPTFDPDLPGAGQ